jgi:hypothetical protein
MVLIQYLALLHLLVVDLEAVLELALIRGVQAVLLVELEIILVLQEQPFLVRGM